MPIARFTGVLMRKPRGQRTRPHKLRLFALGFVGAISLGSVIASVVIGFTINGQPPFRPFPGWVTVLQPASQPAGDVIGLKSSIADPSDPTSVEYDVMACGSHPYHGILVIGRQARLA